MPLMTLVRLLMRSNRLVPRGQRQCARMPRRQDFRRRAEQFEERPYARAASLADPQHPLAGRLDKVLRKRRHPGHGKQLRSFLIEDRA